MNTLVLSNSLLGDRYFNSIIRLFPFFSSFSSDSMLGYVVLIADPRDYIESRLLASMA